MTLAGSGTMSLGGDTAGRSVNYELRRSNTGTITMEEADVRSLAQRNTSASSICMNNFYGKRAPAPSIGSSFQGGYYIGTISSWYVITSNSSQHTTAAAAGGGNCHAAQGATSYDDGYYNTHSTNLGNIGSKGNFVKNLNHNGYDDWYWPAYHEVYNQHAHRNSMPAGQGYPGGHISMETSTEGYYPGYGPDSGLHHANFSNWEVYVNSKSTSAGNAYMRPCRRYFY